MFENKNYKSNWNQLISTNMKLKLVRFNYRPPGTFEDHIKDAREYYGADREDKKRFKLYFGDENTEQNFLLKETKQYKDYVEYCNYWNGICKVGETIELIRQRDPADVVLTKKWTGKLIDHKELVVELWEEKTFFRQHVKYYCDIYSSGTLTILSDSPDVVMMNARPGEYQMWNSREKNVYVNVDNKNNIFCVDDAVFEIDRN